jgi:DNA topoisomerase-3
MLEQMPPDGYKPEWGNPWRMEALPIRPDTWKVLPKEYTAKQLKIVGEQLKQSTSLVIATDADREGEMIARELLDYFSYRGPVQRLWLSALDAESVKRALKSLKTGRETEPLYRAALARSRADWLVGMNLTRAATVKLGNGPGVLSVGRVQTPTLALVVRRDELIENFRSRNYYELLADVAAGIHRLTLKHAPGEDDRIYDRAAADSLAQRAQGARGPLAVKSERKRQAPPKLFSLLTLQKAANKKWGWSADKTLEVAQALYETHKATTYPRSDCPFLPNEQESDVPIILKHLAGVPGFETLATLAAPEIRKSVFDTKKITAHHAIIPTTVSAPWAKMSDEEQQLFLLIARHFLACLYPDHEFQHTTVALDANGVAFKATGRVPLVAGWRVVFGEELPEDDEKKDASVEPATLPPVSDGLAAAVDTVRVDSKRTTPPARYTEGTLLEDMARIAKYIDDPAKKAKLKETSGIGTEATRASIIEKLKNTKTPFLITKGRSILSSDAGRALIHRLSATLSDPGETAVWEDRLEAIAQGQESVESFLTEINAKVAALIGELRNVETAVAVAADAPSCPLCEKPMRRRTGKNGSFWGCSAYPECRGTRNDENATPATSSVPPARAKGPVKKKASAKR